MRNTVRPVPREALAHPEGIVVRRIAAALTCVSVALLSACSTPEPSPVPTPETSVGSTTDASEATATSTLDDAVQTTSPGGAGEDPGVPDLPAEAMADTEDGAEAFVKYYIELLNYTGKFPQAGVIEPYGNEDCLTCDVLAEETSDLEAEALRYDTDSLRVDSIEALPFEGGYRVQLRGEATKSAIIDNNGVVQSSTEPVPELAWAFQLQLLPSGFAIDWIKSVEG